MNDKKTFPYKNSLGENILTGLSNDVFNLSEFDILKLYFNDLPPSVEEITKNHHVVDGITYRFNSRGFRSPEFKENVEFLIGGCSLTYGVGVEEDKVWSHLLCKKLNVEYANLSIPANSVGKIIRDFFAYFKLYGHPKTIICLFPPFERIELPITEKLIKPFNWKKIKERSKGKDDLHSNQYIQSIQLYFSPELNIIDKKPFNAETTIPTDMAHFYAAQSILMFQQYCDVAKINFIYSFWDSEHANIIKKMNNIQKNYYKGYVDIEIEKWKYNNKSGIDELYENNIYMKDKKEFGSKVECHSELRKLDSNFDIGADRFNGNEHAHWGSHRHLHIAENFYNIVKNEIKQ